MATTSNDLDLNLKNSRLILDGTKKDQEMWSKRIDKRADYLSTDKNERKAVYKIRRDFYVGNHEKYSNILGLINKEKKGHANAVINYAGKTVQKISQGLSNNPPNITFPIDFFYKPDDTEYDTEDVRTQGVEDWIEVVMRNNRFWKRGYRRGCFNQATLGDFGIKVYPVNKSDKDNPDWDIRIINLEKIDNLLVGWRGDDAKDFDYVIVEEQKSLQSIKEEWGIKIPLGDADKPDDTVKASSSHYNNSQWGNTASSNSSKTVPSGVTNIPSITVSEYDDENVYAIKIGNQLVQLVYKDNINLPKMKFWVLGENIPNPGSHWSIADIDYLISPNIELNEGSNDERDYIRVGANQKFVAYNMSDFDPESVKTGSGGVIFVDSPDGTSKFEALQTNVNTYPATNYLSRIKKHIHDLGVPEVTFGSSGADSGRSKVIDYQSLVDLVVFKRDSWELVLDEICEKIQILGYFYFKYDFFTDVRTKKFKVRHPEFDWTDIIPITVADKVVTIVNKVQMGLPFELAFKELGYRDVDAVINLMKKEAKDPDLMTFRAKMFNVSPGLVQAQGEAQSELAQMGAATTNPNGMAESPTLITSQNQGRTSSLPVSQAGGTTSFSSPQGYMERVKQNLNARQG